MKLQIFLASAYLASSASLSLFDLSHLGAPGADVSYCDTCSADCADCEKCVDTHDGDCAKCWEGTGFQGSQPCLAADVVTSGGCRGCFKADAPPMVVVPGLTSGDLKNYKHDVLECQPPVRAPEDIWPLKLVELIGKGARDCFKVESAIEFNNDTKVFSSPPGVETGVTSFDINGSNFGPYVSSNLNPYGFKVGVNLYGATFDWRYNSDGLEGYYLQVKKLVEDVSDKLQQKVVLRALSYGPQIALGFLHRMEQSWKDKYISWYIADSPVFAGTPALVEALTSGFQIYGPSPQFVLDIEREIGWTLPAFLWVLPKNGNDQYTYRKDEVLIYTPSKNYTAWDFPEMMKDLGHADKIDQYNFMNQGDLGIDTFKAPGVNSFVNYGYGLTCPGAIHFDQDFVPGQLTAQPTLVENATESGDGIVPLRGGLRSHTWHEAMALANKTLVIKGYEELQHASCFFGAGGFGPDPIGSASLCFSESMNIILNQITPSSGRCGASAADAADCTHATCANDQNCGEGLTCHVDVKLKASCSHSRCGMSVEGAEASCSNVRCTDDSPCAFLGQKCFSGLNTATCDGL